MGSKASGRPSPRTQERPISIAPTRAGVSEGSGETGDVDGRRAARSQRLAAAPVPSVAIRRRTAGGATSLIAPSCRGNARRGSTGTDPAMAITGALFPLATARERGAPDAALAIRRGTRAVGSTA